jgi:hypothetical protein
MALASDLTFVARGTFGGVRASILRSGEPAAWRTLRPAARRFVMRCCLAARRGRIIFGSGGDSHGFQE